MGVLGMIAEYNPFHNGHLYHLQKSKELTESDFSVCIISGNFVQRGNTSLIDKWSKAEMAIANGVDLVIELPTIYSISSAENFARGAISLLDSLKIVDCVCFGSEIGELNVLDEIAEVLYEEPSTYKTLLNHELQLGNSYPKARENAVLMYLNDIRKYANILSSPNNILAIEYLKALRENNSCIKPFTIKRFSTQYHSIETHLNFASASAIRQAILDNNLISIENTLPSSSLEILKVKIDRGEIVPDLSVFEKIILYNLRKMSIEEISELPDVSEGLEHNIKNAANCCNHLSDLITYIKSKRYTHSRISRILLYSLLAITKKDIEYSFKQKVPYVRILGFNSKGQELISRIVKANPKLPIITSVKKFIDTNSNKQLSRILDIDTFATDTYTLGYEYNSFANLDYTHELSKKKMS